MTALLTSIDPLTDSNCYFIEEEGHVLIIDPNQREEIVKSVEEHKWIVDYAILTHEHCDHMQGLNELRKQYHFPVIAQEKCSENLQNKIKNMSGMMETYLYFKNGGKKIISYEPFTCKRAEIIFKETYKFNWKGHHFFLKSVPGHTAGSCVIFMDKTNLFSGDYLLASKEDPTIFPGGSKEMYETYAKPWIASLEKGLHVYPGHGKDYKLEK